MIKGREEEVAAFHKIITDLEAREESLLPNGFGKLWLGNLVHTLGGNWEWRTLRSDFTEKLKAKIRTYNVTYGRLNAQEEPETEEHVSGSYLSQLCKAFHYTQEDIQDILRPMAAEGTEPGLRTLEEMLREGGVKIIWKMN